MSATPYTIAYLASGSRSLHTREEAAALTDLNWQWPEMDTFHQHPINRLLRPVMRVGEWATFIGFYPITLLLIIQFIATWHLPTWAPLLLGLPVAWALFAAYRSHEHTWRQEHLIERFMLWAWYRHNVALTAAEASNLYDGERTYTDGVQLFGRISKQIAGTQTELRLQRTPGGECKLATWDGQHLNPLPVVADSENLYAQ